MLTFFSADGSDWKPEPKDVICSAHFVGNCMSDSQISLSYIPTIFVNVYREKITDEKSALKRSVDICASKLIFQLIINKA